MKKTVIIIQLAFLALSMAACNSTASPSDSSGGSSLNPADVLVEFEYFSVPDLTESENDSVFTQYELGDIILADGSIVKEADLAVVDNVNVPIAVIAGFRGDGTAFGIGVHRSDTPLQWAADENTEDAAVNYPAFHFVDTYAETYDLSGDYGAGWYMPGIDELCDIYQNREAINNALQHIYSLDNHAAMNGLGTNWYWSATQADVQDDYAWFVHYYNGYAGECPKNFTNVHALAVHELIVPAS